MPRLLQSGLRRQLNWIVDQQRSQNPLARFLQSIPVPRGPQWYLVAYRWVLVAAGLYTVVVTWNVWQVRSGPGMELAPMLPLWDWLPQASLGWPVAASLLLILVAPWTGLIAYSVVLAAGIALDLTRLQPPFLISFLLLGTMPNVNAQMLGRAYLIALWFWAGFHKLIIDFIKPEEMLGFRSDIIPMDLAKHFPPDQYAWSTHDLGVAIGWVVSLAEASLAVLCFVPRARKLVGALALVMHLSIAAWHCLPNFMSSVLAWNVALSLAGLAFIAPWRERTWPSLQQCHPAIRALFIFLLIYPIGYYFNWINGYLSHCIYVPNNTNAILRRPGDEPREVHFLALEITRLPLPPGHEILERYFDKIKKPGDEVTVGDPRPWARANGLHGRQLTFDGELRDGKPHGHWVNRDTQDRKLSEGDFDNGLETGHWIYWYPDGRKAMEGNYISGQSEGVWQRWTPDGERSTVEFRAGVAVQTPDPKK